MLNNNNVMHKYILTNVYMLMTLYIDKYQKILKIHLMRAFINI